MKLIRARLVSKRENRIYEQVEGDRFTTLLIHKAYEELHEVAEQMLLTDIDPTDLMEEMGDLLEIIYTMADWFGLDMEIVEAFRKAKSEERGDFTERWVII